MCGDEKCIQNFGWKNLEVERRIITWKAEFVWVAWIRPAQDRDQWLALVNTVMNLQVP
jgi:hypothetical protein